MIVDELPAAGLYESLHPGFKQAFEYLRTHDFSGMPTGRNEIDGERLFVIINRLTGRGRSGSPLEYHNQYIDIQYTIQGPDEIGWRARGKCSQVKTPFDAAKDFGLFGDEPETWVTVPAGSFAIFYPQDAHAPQGATVPLLKAVVKVAVTW